MVALYTLGCMDGIPMPDISLDAINNYGPLAVVFAVVLAILVHWYFKRYPDERREQQNRDQMLFEQVALSRQALETSNLVITQNSEELREARSSHHRLGERMGCLEETVVRHDQRAEQIAKDTAQILADTGAMRHRHQ